MVSNFHVKYLEDTFVVVEWDKKDDVDSYHLYWSDKNLQTSKFKMIADVKENMFVLHKSTHVPHYFKLAYVKSGKEVCMSHIIQSGVKRIFHEQREKLSRGVVAVATNQGVFLSWRMFYEEAKGYNATGLTGTNYRVYKNGKLLCEVTDSTNYLDVDGTNGDHYSIAAYEDGIELDVSKEVIPWNENYIEVPLQKPEGGKTVVGQEFEYSVNDMSIGDVDGDGEYEYFVKWDPSNAHDVSHTGYTGSCYIDCYKLSGRLLWRLDMGCNIRAGAHYTQFIVYDFNQDGKAEMCVKTAPGTKMIKYNADGSIESESYISMLQSDLDAGYRNTDNYVCSASDYREHMINVFCDWQNHQEVVNGHWPKTLEECFGIKVQYEYPLSREDSTKLVDYLINEYAPKRSAKIHLEKFEGFIYEGPEYLTMFSGLGDEIETIQFKFGREDDGLIWGDYSFWNIEPCNRVDRFLSGVAYLDGERPYVVICRGYYTRATVVTYSFFENHFEEYFSVDSGHVIMSNPFNDNPHIKIGSNPKYGILAGQGNHSLSTADVDGDGYQEIIYGAAVIDHNGDLLYSSYGMLPDGTYAKFGHGDAMHVADIDPDRPGLEIFNVFETGRYAPYGFALRDAENGEAIFGEFDTRDLGRCMVGDINPNVRGLQTWVYDVRSCTGEILEDNLLGTNFNIKWSADLSTQIIDGKISDEPENWFKKQTGKINDNTHGIMFANNECLTNNGSKGNPCLVADLFGDFREEIILRRSDDKAIRIFTNTELTQHKLFTFMHDTQYRTGIAWQNNCYNQPAYTKFYYASDMDFQYVKPELL